MKDSRFIELINLYIDRQISSDETAELEAEIQANPRRRQVYRQYCQMHHATKLVYESFGTNGEKITVAARPSASIARFESRRRAQLRNRWLYAAGGLAAAACLGFALLRALPKPVAPAAGAPAQVVAAVSQPKPAPTSAVAVAKVIPFSAAVQEQPDYAAMLAALRREEQRTIALSQSIRNNPLFDDGVFDAKATLPIKLRSNAPAKTDAKANAEFTAFQFQR